MDDKAINDIEVAPLSVAKQTAHDFAAALSERFRQDQAAQQAFGAYQEKQISLRALMMLNSFNLSEREQLRSKCRVNWLGRP